MVKKFNNREITEIYNKLSEAFKDDKKYIPVKIGFFIQKNSTTFKKLAREIEINRLRILYEYGCGEPDENGMVLIPPDKRESVQKELDDLGGIEQEIEIREILLEDISSLELTLPQIAALEFMIEE